MVQVLLTGASGFLGRHILRLLAGQPGVRVTTASRSAASRSTATHSGAGGAVGHVQLNFGVDGPDRVGELLAELGPDVVVNCAGAVAGSTAELAEANIVGPATLVHAMLRHAPTTRLIHLGSAAEYGATAPGVAIAESTPARPVGDYGATKLAGTSLVTLARSAGLDALTLRVFNPVGSGAPANSLPGRLAAEIRRATAEGDVVRLGPLDAVRDFVDAHDVAAAVWQAVTAAATSLVSTLDLPVLNVGSGRGVAVRELVDILVRIADFRGKIVESATGSTRSASVPWQCADISAIGAALGWRPRTSLIASLDDLWQAV
jgi:nucleoside-diphosphate-sugar epimerase